MRVLFLNQCNVVSGNCFLDEGNEVTKGFLLSFKFCKTRFKTRLVDVLASFIGVVFEKKNEISTAGYHRLGSYHIIGSD